MSKFEIPEFKKKEIKNNQINNYLNSSKNVLSDNFDYASIQKIQEELLDRFRTEIKINFLSDENGRNFIVASKQVPVISKEEKNSYVYSKNSN